MNESIELIDGLSFENTQRLSYSVSLLRLSVEHRNSIHILVKHGLPGSAHALARPQLEATIRGLWLADHASDQEVQDYINGSEPPGVHIQLDVLEKSTRFQGALLRSAKQRNWKLMHDLTHAGAKQAGASIKSGTVAAGYSAQDLIALLDLAASTAAFSAACMADTCGNRPVASKVAKQYAAIYRAEA